LGEFRGILEATAAFTTFAAQYIGVHKIDPGWELPPQILDQFQAWLAERQIQPGLREWIANRDFLEWRLKTEIYNLAFGVEKGDEVAVHSDPPVQKALEAVLKGTA
jgi:hypothetical protein